MGRSSQRIIFDEKYLNFVSLFLRLKKTYQSQSRKDFFQVTVKFLLFILTLTVTINLTPNRTFTLLSHFNVTLEKLDQQSTSKCLFFHHPLTLSDGTSFHKKVKLY